MAASYHCDNCEVTAPSLVGWVLVRVQFLHEDPNIPTPPGGMMIDGAAPDLTFHDITCRDAWCTKAGVPAPVAPA